MSYRLHLGPVSAYFQHSRADKRDVCEHLAPVPNLGQDLHVSDGDGTRYSDLHSLKRQGRPGKSLTAGQKREKKNQGGG